MSLSRGEAYCILELPIGVDPDSIRRSYKRLAMKCHPDKHRGAQFKEAFLKFQQVSKAYKRLITDSDVTVMSQKEMFDLYQQTFHSHKSATTDASSKHCTVTRATTTTTTTTTTTAVNCNGSVNGTCHVSNSDNEQDAQTTESPAKNVSSDVVVGDCDDRERLRAERKKAKKKKKELKRLEKQLNTDQVDKASSSDSVSAATKNHCETGTATNVRSNDSGSDSEELDAFAAFYGRVLNRNKKLSVINNSSDAPNISLSQTKHVIDAAIPTTTTTTTTATESLDPVVVQSRQLAIAGNEMANSGDYIQAINLFTQAIALDPTDFRFFGNRSYCYDRMQLYDRALTDAERAISLSFNWPKGHFRKARALAGLKRYAEAELCFRQVLVLDPQCDDAEHELLTLRHLQLTQLSQQQQITIQQQQETFLHQRPTSTTAVSPVPLQCLQTSRVVSAPRNTSNVYHTTPSASSLLMGPQASIKMDPSNPEGLTALWVGNVLPKVSEQTLVQMFSKYGTVTSIRSLPDKFCAFVNFKDKRSAGQALIGLQGAECAGQKLLIKFPDNPLTAFGGSSPGKKLNNKQSAPHYKK